MKISHCLLLLFFAFLLPTALVLLLVAEDSKMKGNEPSTKIAYLKTLYANGDLVTAKKEMGAHPDELIPYHEGCELILSVFAKLENDSSLYEFSQKCLLNGKMASGLTYEALASSSLKLSKEADAKALLEAELGSHHDDRLLVALAQLYFKTEDLQKSKFYFSKLIDKSTIWSAWLARALKFKPLFKDPEFVDSLVAQISKKLFISKEVEEKLLLYAKLYKLDVAINTLEKRLSKV